MLNTNKKNNMLLWAAMTAAVLLVILFFGLRPKGLCFENPATLNPETHALSFSRHGGIALVDDLKIPMPPHRDRAFTIEVVVRAGSVDQRGFDLLLMMHAGNDADQLIVGQWESNIIIMNGNDYDHTRKLPRLSVKNAFDNKQTRLITITASEQGTRLYLDGRLAGADQNWRLKIPTRLGHKLKMVLGNSVSGKHSWIGEIYGFALYGSALSPKIVKHHYDAWVRDNRLPYAPTDHPLILYAFAGQSDHFVPDLSGRNQPLQIPLWPIVLKKEFLSPPWHHFKAQRSFFIDAVLNLIGFIPLGMVLFGLQRAIQFKSAKFVSLSVVASCFFVSLGIEITQAWMPTRSSSLLDLVLNTLGAASGIWLFKRAGRFRKPPSISTVGKKYHLF